MEIKGEILTENSLLEYLFSAHLTLFHNVTPQIYFRSNIPVTNGEDIDLTTDKILEYFLMDY
jgi:hypothetical protein